MKKSWVKGLDQGQAEDVEAAYKASGLLRSRIKEMLDELQETAVNTTLLKDNYSQPNWDKKQADTVGYIRALKEISNLF